ncbi:MAG: hypothetical protein ACTHOD_00715 [Motilibacteraceae bacterium]
MAIRPAPPSPPSRAARDEARRLTRWSFLMLPTALLLAVVLVVPSVWVLHLLGLQEGDLLLMAGGWAGWTAESAFDLAQAVPLLAGMWLATRALRLGAHWPGWLALGLNAAGVLLCVYVYVDAISLTYWPSGH